MSETDGFKYQFAQLSFSFRFKGNLAVYIHVYSIWLNLKTNYSSSGSYCNCSPYCHITLNNTHTHSYSQLWFQPSTSAAGSSLPETSEAERSRWSYQHPAIITHMYIITHRAYSMSAVTQGYTGRAIQTNPTTYKLPRVGLLNPRTLERALLHRAIQTNNHFMPSWHSGFICIGKSTILPS